MNFLSLAQRTQSECGITGDPMVAVTAQSTELMRIVRWVNAAWMEIQQTHSDWEFMRTPFSFNTIAAQQTYTAVQAGVPLLGNWKRDSFRLYLAASGVSNEMIMPFVSYDQFRNLYLYGSMRTTVQRPVMFSIDPQKNIVLGAMPDDIYNINGEFYLPPTEMVATTDAPTLPTEFHLAIVYRAMIHYGMYEAAPEVVQRGTMEFNKMMSRLEIDRMPDIVFGPPLA